MKTKITLRLFGVLVMALGVGIVSIDYFIVKAMFSVGTWGAAAVNVPEIGFGITLLLCIALLVTLCLLSLSGCIVFVRGLMYAIGDDN